MALLFSCKPWPILIPSVQESPLRGVSGDGEGGGPGEEEEESGVTLSFGNRS